jgi:hypothetical protein
MTVDILNQQYCIGFIIDTDFIKLIIKLKQLVDIWLLATQYLLFLPLSKYMVDNMLLFMILMIISTNPKRDTLKDI